jgi:uncharacterized SAM-binding protein YcdF (DUF218 family)
MWAIAKSLTWVTSPLGTVFLLFLLTGLLRLLGRAVWASRTAYAAVAWLWLWSTPAASGWLAAKLESGSPRLTQRATMPSAPAAVVLGGAIATPSLDRPLPSLTDSSDRVWQAARLYRDNRSPLLLLSGGSDPSVALEPEAQSMKTFLMELGVPSDRLILETRSRTTRENARYSAALLKDRGIESVILVTSALHMKRAIMEFEAAGLTVHPVAVNATLPPSWRTAAAWLPDAAALRTSAFAMKEVVGRLATWARSRT